MSPGIAPGRRRCGGCTEVGTSNPDSVGVQRGRMIFGAAIDAIVASVPARQGSLTASRQLSLRRRAQARSVPNQRQQGSTASVGLARRRRCEGVRWLLPRADAPHLAPMQARACGALARSLLAVTSAARTRPALTIAFVTGGQSPAALRFGDEAPARLRAVSPLPDCRFPFATCLLSAGFVANTSGAASTASRIRSCRNSMWPSGKPLVWPSERFKRLWGWLRALFRRIGIRCS